MSISFKKRNFSKKSLFSKLFLIFFVALMVFFSTASSLLIEPEIVYAQATTTPAASPAGGDADMDFNCGFWNPENCIALFVYGLIYKPAGLFLALTGYLFDAVVAFSLSNEVIGGSTLVTTGWTLTRDITNSVFIFIILYIAIALILRVGSINAKRTLVTLVAVALLLNFSLFFSRLVIDASNVAAYTFYQHMGEVKGSGETKPITDVSYTGIEERTLSVAFVNGFKPQKLIGEGMWQKLRGGAEQDTQFTLFFFLFIIAAIVNFIAAIAFITVGFLFLIRIVALWLLMILAPLAMAALILPQTQKYFRMWWSKLLSYSFIAPVFLFFFYLILTLIDAGNSAILGMFSTTTVTEFLPTLTIMILVGAFYIILMIAAVTITTRLSSEAGGASTKIGKWAGGKVLGGYVGTAGLVTRQTVGRGANAWGNKYDDEYGTRAARWKAQGGLKKYAAYGVDRTARSSFDVKNTALNGVGGYKMGQGQQGGFRSSLESRVAEQKQIEEGIVDPEARNEYRRKIESERGLFNLGSQTNRARSRDVGRIEAQYGNIQSEDGKAEFLTMIDKDIARRIYEKQNDKDRVKLGKSLGDLADRTDKKARRMEPANPEQAKQIQEEAGRIRGLAAPMEEALQSRERVSSDERRSDTWVKEKKEREKNYRKAVAETVVDDAQKTRNYEGLRKTIEDSAKGDQKTLDEISRQLSPELLARYLREGIAGGNKTARNLQARIDTNLSSEQLTKLQVEQFDQAQNMRERRIAVLGMPGHEYSQNAQQKAFNRISAAEIDSFIDENKLSSRQYNEHNRLEENLSSQRQRQVAEERRQKARRTESGGGKSDDGSVSLDHTEML